MRSITILIVEDEVVVRNVVVMALARAGYAVLEAHDAVEALKLSSTFEGVIDLLIADYALKTMTGREVAAKISQSRPGLRVLHISGYSLQVLQHKEGREAISNAVFLGKPFLPKDLVEKVKAILSTVREEYPYGAVGSVH